jgi:hypothetical protein
MKKRKIFIKRKENNYERIEFNEKIENNHERVKNRHKKKGNIMMKK